MTFDELNRHLDLLRELQKAQERLERLCLKAYPGAQNLDGMPHGSGVRDKAFSGYPSSFITSLYASSTRMTSSLLA